MPRVYVGLRCPDRNVVVLFLFNCAADLSLGWARREERKRGKRQSEREREGGWEGERGRDLRDGTRERKSERERERARATDR